MFDAWIHVIRIVTNLHKIICITISEGVHGRERHAVSWKTSNEIRQCSTIITIIIIKAFVSTEQTDTPVHPFFNFNHHSVSVVPTGLSTSSPQTTSITLTWKKPAMNGELVEAYQVILSLNWNTGKNNHVLFLSFFSCLRERECVLFSFDCRWRWFVRSDVAKYKIREQCGK